MPVLRVAHVYRDYVRRGVPTVHALQDVSLDIEAGQILGLVGINGAGKTTLTKICATALAPTTGEVHIDGIDAVHRPHDARKHIGWMLGGDKGLYQRATVRENLRFYADVAGVSFRNREASVRRVLDAVNLGEKAERKVYELSKGQVQRVRIARAILGSPSLLLLDEPTSGLDPDVSLHIRDVIRRIADSGVAVLLTSHSMGEIEELADRIAILNSGKIRVSGSIDDVLAYAGIREVSECEVLPSARWEMQLAVDLLKQYGHISSRPSGSAWHFTMVWNPDHSNGSQSKDELMQRIFDESGAAQVSDLHTRKANLEDAFLSISQGAAADAQAESLNEEASE